MNKETFLEIIELIRKQHKIETDFADSLSTIINGCFVPQMADNIWAAARLLFRDNFGDSETFEWWLWDLDGIYGDDEINKEIAWFSLSDKSERIYVRTAEELWENCYKNLQ